MCLQFDPGCGQSGDKLQKQDAVLLFFTFCLSIQITILASIKPNEWNIVLSVIMEMLFDLANNKIE